MTIETKFNVSDIAWVKLDGLARKVRISHIQINIYIIGIETATRIWYEFDNDGGMYKEDEFYKTKEALLQSL